MNDVDRLPRLLPVYGGPMDGALYSGRCDLWPSGVIRVRRDGPIYVFRDDPRIPLVGTYNWSTEAFVSNGTRGEWLWFPHRPDAGERKLLCLDGPLKGRAIANPLQRFGVLSSGETVSESDRRAIGHYSWVSPSASIPSGAWAWRPRPQ